jgi:hypothetical protein
MATRLDGAGQAKLDTLETALTQLQRVHAIVERLAAAARIEQNTAPFRQQIQRAASPMVGLLKAQFGSIADQVSYMILVTTRGGGDGPRVRALRESIGQIRAQIETTMNRVRDMHTVSNTE